MVARLPVNLSALDRQTDCKKWLNDYRLVYRPDGGGHTREIMSLNTLMINTLADTRGSTLRGPHVFFLVFETCPSACLQVSTNRSISLRSSHLSRLGTGCLLLHGALCKLACRVDFLHNVVDYSGPTAQLVLKMLPYSRIALEASLVWSPKDVCMWAYI